MLLQGFQEKFADVNGTRLHYVIGGEGSPLVLLPGFPLTWWQFHKIMPELARSHQVIAVDIRGMGNSDKPHSGYDKKTMAEDVHKLLLSLGHETFTIGGEDIGGMVAYSLAANHPESVEKLLLWETVHPTEALYEIPMLPRPGQSPHMWWLAFSHTGNLAERLLEGRFRAYLDEIVDAYPGEKTEAMDSRSREIYTAAYEQPGAVRAGHAWYQAWHQDIADERTYAPVRMPTLFIAGHSYPLIAPTIRRQAEDLHLVELKGAGHFLSEERPEDLIRELRRFLMRR